MELVTFLRTQTWLFPCARDALSSEECQWAAGQLSLFANSREKPVLLFAERDDAVERHVAELAVYQNSVFLRVHTHVFGVLAGQLVSADIRQPVDEPQAPRLLECHAPHVVWTFSVAVGHDDDAVLDSALLALQSTSVDGGVGGRQQFVESRLSDMTAASTPAELAAELDTLHQRSVAITHAYQCMSSAQDGILTPADIEALSAAAASSAQVVARSGARSWPSPPAVPVLEQQLRHLIASLVPRCADIPHASSQLDALLDELDQAYRTDLLGMLLAAEQDGVPPAEGAPRSEPRPDVERVDDMHM